MEYVYQYVERDIEHGIVCIHRIKASDDEPRGGWYRQVSSFSAFYRRLLHRWHDHWRVRVGHKARMRFGQWNQVETEMYNEMSKHWEEYSGERRPDLTYTDWDSLWDFYDHIGYNHKNRSVKELDKFIFIKE